MTTNRLVAGVAGIIVVLVAALMVIPSLLRGSGSAAPRATVPDAVSPTGVADRTRPPVVDGHPLPPASEASRPPRPAQWAGGTGPVPTNTWWSSAVTGPGSAGLWPQPLGLRIDERGEVQVAAPLRVTQPDGSADAPFVPAVFVEPDGPSSTRVIGHGPLHVVLRIRPRTTPATDLTLVQGSPLVEVRTQRPLVLRIPGLEVDAPPKGAVESLRFTTGEGPWLVASADAARIHVVGDVLTVDPTASGRFVFGPVLDDARAGYADRARTIAQHPLVSTSESVSVAPDGTTSQTLTQHRTGGPSATTASLWALQPHHQRYGTRLPRPLGTVSSPLGTLPVVASRTLRLIYPPVPVLWSAVSLPGAADLPALEPAETTDGLGSYYGGKAVYTSASAGDALRADGQDGAAERADQDAVHLLDRLAGSQGAPSLRWEDTWGSVLIEPAEFGAGTELNDHQLQYGYWVAAAAHLADTDPEAADRYRDLIDLLIADYAGAETVPGSTSSLPAERTWSPYEGHSWASGTARFGAGNNLESISESSLSWWAAARWMLATGRPAAARTFIARFTIESALTGTSWLPQGDHLPTDPARRPWSGVVWSSKIDRNTWFDPNDESALGIRLLPVGPAGLARYATPQAIDAADARWDWCEAHGQGCGVRWGNVLDTDAVVAGRPVQSTPDPEPATTATMTAWWRDLWTRSSPADGWTCSVGAVARERADGSVVVLASSPGRHPTKLTCRDRSGQARWTAQVTDPVAAVVSS